MRQVPLHDLPASTDPAFLDFVRQVIIDLTGASAENVFEPETLDVYAKIDSPTFTGAPAAPTPDPGSNDTSIATTAFVTGAVAEEVIALDAAIEDAIAQEVTDRDTAIATAISGLSSTIIEAIFGMIAVPTNKDYTIALKAPFAFTITETTTKSVSGTCTATIKINSTALGGAAHSVSSTEETIARSSANAVAVGDDIVITVSSNSTCLDFSFTIKTTRTIS
jgi:hypothetical protein